MTNFKIGDIVEVDWSDPNNSDLKNNKYFQGTMKVESSDSEYLYFTHQPTGHGCSAYKTRFKLVERVKESKPAKKPHAWVVVNVHNGSIRCVKNTRGEARQIKQNLRMIATTQVKKVFLEFAE